MITREVGKIKKPSLYTAFTVIKTQINGTNIKNVKMKVIKLGKTLLANYTVECKLSQKFQ